MIAMILQRTLSVRMSLSIKSLKIDIETFSDER